MLGDARGGRVHFFVERNGVPPPAAPTPPTGVASGPANRSRGVGRGDEHEGPMAQWRYSRLV